MAKITLKNLRHSYLAEPQNKEDYALQQVDAEWSDGLFSTDKWIEVVWGGVY